MTASVLSLSLALATDGDLTHVLKSLFAGVGSLQSGTIVNLSGENEVRGLSATAGIRLTATIAGSHGNHLERGDI